MIASFRVRTPKRPAAACEERLEIGGRSLPLVIVRSPRARRAALRVDATRGEIRLTLPPRVAEARARRLIETHREWIADRVASLPLPRPFMAGAEIPFEGEILQIIWDAHRPRVPVHDAPDGRLIVGGPAEGLHGRVERWLRRRALEVLSEESRAYAEKAGKPVAGVRLGDPKGRWGSCTSGGRIAYSWRLVMAPPWVRQSVVAHEVAHLVHLNHSPAFHALHRKLLGSDPACARAWLAANGPALYWVGRAG